MISAVLSELRGKKKDYFHALVVIQHDLRYESHDSWWLVFFRIPARVSKQHTQTQLALKKGGKKKKTFDFKINFISFYQNKQTSEK